MQERSPMTGGATTPLRWGFFATGLSAFVLLLSVHVRFWSPEFGLTRLLKVGGEFEDRGIATFRSTPKFVDRYPPNRWGFDGQMYAEIALDPLLKDPQLKNALDGLVYRGRRIFLPWVAWLGGLGRPAWVLNVCAALNLVSWVGYAWLMRRLFQPHGWRGLAGYAATLLTCGVMVSMGGALTDFPSVTLMFAATALGGTGGAVILSLATLTRESSLLGLSALAEFGRPWSASLRTNAVRGLAVVGPLLAWTAYVLWRCDSSRADFGENNLGIPFGGIMAQLGELSVSLGPRVRWHYWFFELYKSAELHGLLTIVALATQCIFLVLHRDWQNRWWRLGVVFIPYFVLIGYLTWEADITRQVLPITIVFNLLLAARPGRGWVVWFLLGNLFVPYSVHAFYMQPGQHAPPAPAEYATTSPAGETALGVAFGPGWTPQQWDENHTWRWARENGAILTLRNDSRQPVRAELSGRFSSRDPRGLTCSLRGDELWRGELRTTPQTIRVTLWLKPGENALNFATAQPGTDLGELVTGPVTFRLENLTVTRVD